MQLVSRAVREWLPLTDDEARQIVEHMLQEMRQNPSGAVRVMAARVALQVRAQAESERWHRSQERATADRSDVEALRAAMRDPAFRAAVLSMDLNGTPPALPGPADPGSSTPSTEPAGSSTSSLYNPGISDTLPSPDPVTRAVEGGSSTPAVPDSGVTPVTPGLHPPAGLETPVSRAVSGGSSTSSLYNPGISDTLPPSVQSVQPVTDPIPTPPGGFITRVEGGEGVQAPGVATNFRKGPALKAGEGEENVPPVATSFQNESARETGEGGKAPVGGERTEEGGSTVEEEESGEEYRGRGRRFGGRR